MKAVINMLISWRKLLLIWFIAVLMMISTTSADAAIKLAEEPGADPAVMLELQKNIDAFNDILYKEIQINLEKPVMVYFCPTREIYGERLISLLHMEKGLADRTAQASGGFSNGYFNTILINGGAPKSKSARGRADTMAHELFHQVQSQLMSGNKKAEPFKWMQEGTADYTASRIIETMGYQSQEKWKLERINILRKADKHVSSSEILTINLDGWTKMMEDKRYPYEMSDLMVFYLATQTKGNFYQAVRNYYERIGKGEAGDSEAFKHAFGLTLGQYLQGFSEWYMTTALDSAQIEVINFQDKVSQDTVETAKRAGELSRSFFVSKFGEDIQTSQRIVLVANDDDYVSAISKEFGYTLEAAGQKAQNNTIIFQGNTFIQKTKDGNVFGLAHMLALQYQQDLASDVQLKKLHWLHYGSGMVVAAYVNELAGINTVEKYRAGLLRTLAKAKLRPGLSELVTVQSYAEAAKKYGVSTNNRVAALAAMYIVDKYGLKSFSEWCKAVKELNDPEKAFVKTFGISTVQFSTEFEAYLAANLK
jgi:AraC-like DNA-binding protein